VSRAVGAIAPRGLASTARAFLPFPLPFPALLAAAAVAVSLLFTTPVSGATRAPANADYLADLVARARALHLSDHSQWLALGHYRRDRLGSGMRSPARGHGFFLAGNGRTNPQAELEATLARFFDDAAGPDERHPQCAFPARYAWLNRQLRFDPHRLPAQPCREFHAWQDAIAPTGLSLIFPEAFMNNPASMFGHTLLRFDTGPPESRKDLLAYAVNFAAETRGDGGAAFAVKGILGFYDGFFSIRPYYEMVQAYGDWQNRDIWEYRLALPGEAVDLMLMHLWELRDVPFSYYFFDDNCSYQLLSLIEVGQPDLQVLDRIPTPWVIPADTVRAVAQESGLVTEVSFRPSAATELRFQERRLPPDLRRLARQIADGAVAPTDPRLAQCSDADRATVLGVAYDRLRYLYLAHRVTRADSEARSRQILLARSRVPVEQAALPAVPAPAVSPEQGHLSARFALGSGWYNDRFFLEVRLRPAFHDLMDPSGGYTAGAQINFLDVAVRAYPTKPTVRLQEVSLIDIVSLAPRDLFFDPISWKFNTGLRSRLVPKDGHTRLAERYVWRTNGGAGVAYQPWRATLFYSLAEATVDAGGALDDSVAAGPGARVGTFIGEARDRWHGHLYGSVIGFVLGDTDTTVRIALDQRLTVTPRTSILVGVAYDRSYGRDLPGAGLHWQLYF